MPSPLARFAVAAGRRAARRRLAALLAGLAVAGGVVVGLDAAGAPRADAAPAAPRAVVAWSAGAPPPTLAATGLFADAATRRLAAGVRAYTPQYPLWTDGARKARWIALPPGASIDATDPAAWSFPVGTRLWKEFAFDAVVETRYLERREDGWVAATYLGPDGGLAPARGVRGAARGAGGARYDVPGRADCRLCHGGRATAVLGFSALQLSPDRDPLAPHAEDPRPTDLDLDGLVAEGRLRGWPADAPAPRIDAPSPRARAALGYLHANCGACHAADGPLAALDLVLDQGAARGPGPTLPTLLGRESRVRVPGAEGALDVRVVPGAPARSVLMHRVASRDPVLAMPPLGTAAVDAEGAALLEAWIREDLSVRAAAPTVPSPRSKENVR